MSDNLIDDRVIDDLADSFSFVVDPDGTCVLYPRLPQLIGTQPWTWCAEEDQALCKQSFVDACMFRKEGIAFEARVLFEGRYLRLSFRLFPLDTGQVLCMFRRIFEGELSIRERHVLALLAGGASSPQIATALGITPSTARDHVANIKRKLNIRRREGFRLAAHFYGLHNGDSGV